MARSQQPSLSKVKNPDIPGEEKCHGKYANKRLVFGLLEQMNWSFHQETQVAERTSVAIKQVEVFRPYSPDCDVQTQGESLSIR